MTSQWSFICGVAGGVQTTIVNMCTCCKPWRIPNRRSGRGGWKSVELLRARRCGYIRGSKVTWMPGTVRLEEGHGVV